MMSSDASPIGSPIGAPVSASFFVLDDFFFDEFAAFVEDFFFPTEIRGFFCCAWRVDVFDFAFVDTFGLPMEADLVVGALFEFERCCISASVSKSPFGCFTVTFGFFCCGRWFFAFEFDFDGDVGVITLSTAPPSIPAPRPPTVSTPMTEPMTASVSGAPEEELESPSALGGAGTTAPV